jgi:tetratricopeptide (TPR) repeat protein
MGAQFAASCEVPMITASFDHLCRTARQAIAQGRIDEARYLFEQALGLRPSSPDAHYGLALASFVLNDLENAAYHFKESARLDPLRAAAYINLGAVLTRLDEHAEAARVLRQAIKIDPQRSEGYYNLGLVYRNVGDLERAASAYRETLRIDPQHADAHYNLANILKEKEEYAAAAAHYRKALEAQPGWEKAERGMAQIEAILGKKLARPEPGEASNPSEAAQADEVSNPSEESPSAEENPQAEQAEAAEQVETAVPDPDRRIEPTKHFAQLEMMHEATKAAQSCGAEFIQAFVAELEPTVHELSMSLIGKAPGTFVNVEPLIEKFEKALAHCRKAHEELQAQIRRAERCGEKILGT